MMAENRLLYLDPFQQSALLEVLDFLEGCIRSGQSACWSFDALGAWPKLSIIRDRLHSDLGQADD